VVVVVVVVVAPAAAAPASEAHNSAHANQQRLVPASGRTADGRPQQHGGARIAVVRVVRARTNGGRAASER